MGRARQLALELGAQGGPGPCQRGVWSGTAWHGVVSGDAVCGIGEGGGVASGRAQRIGPRERGVGVRDGTSIG